MKHPEYDLQKAVCTYLRMQYPDVLFLSDTVASVKLTKAQAVRNKAIQKSDFRCPDIIILEPKGKWCGLFIELKRKSPYKKDGSLLKDEHLEGQQKTIFDLQQKGYFAQFCVGFEETINLIDWYLMLV